jgi:hypothetical protein
MSLDFDVFVVDPKPIPSTVPGFEEAVGPATWPPSTATLISDDGGALLVDCLITVREGRQLAAWVKSRGREPGYVYITHPHADHFLGLPEILAALPDARPVALAESIPAMEEQISPASRRIACSCTAGKAPAAANDGDTTAIRSPGRLGRADQVMGHARHRTTSPACAHQVFSPRATGGDPLGLAGAAPGPRPWAWARLVPGTKTAHVWGCWVLLWQLTA